MPFTPSHAVVALPFVRTPLVPAAIAVGAMSPDLPLFLRGWGLDYSVTHDLRWLPLTMVVALMLLLVWRCLLRPAVRELSPRALAERIPPQWDAGARRGLSETFGMAGTPARVSARAVALLVVSLGVGVMSHIVWDLFTHEGRWGSEVLPVLDQHWGPLTGYKWLQHGSSAAGLAILGVCGLVWVLRQQQLRPVRRMLPEWCRAAWWVSLPVILFGAWAVGLAVHGPITAQWTIPHLAYRVLPSACAVWGALTLALCLIVVVRRAGPLTPRA